MLEQQYMLDCKKCQYPLIVQRIKDVDVYRQTLMRFILKNRENPNLNINQQDQLKKIYENLRDLSSKDTDEKNLKRIKNYIMLCREIITPKRNAISSLFRSKPAIVRELDLYFDRNNNINQPPQLILRNQKAA